MPPCLHVLKATVRTSRYRTVTARGIASLAVPGPGPRQRRHADLIRRQPDHPGASRLPGRRPCRTPQARLPFTPCQDPSGTQGAMPATRDTLRALGGGAAPRFPVRRAISHKSITTHHTADRRVCALLARDSCHAPWRAPNWLLPPPSAYRHLRRVGIESGAPESRTDPLVVSPGQAPEPGVTMIGLPVRFCVSGGIRTCTRRQVYGSLITAAGRNVACPGSVGCEWGAAGDRRRRTARDVLTLLACICSGHRPADGGSRYGECSGSTLARRGGWARCWLFVQGRRVAASQRACSWEHAHAREVTSASRRRVCQLPGSGGLDDAAGVCRAPISSSSRARSRSQSGSRCASLARPTDSWPA